MIKACIFDLDGTLAYTLDSMAVVGNEVVRTTKTDKHGKYTIKNLKKGNYIVTYRNESKAALLNEQN